MRCGICDYSSVGLNSNEYGEEYIGAVIHWDGLHQDFICSVCTGVYIDALRELEPLDNEDENSASESRKS